MIQKVQIDGTTYALDQSKVLGTGGEATVVRVAKWAVKVYHNPTSTRAEKINDYLRASFQLPPSVCSPLKAALDTRGRKTVGFAMQPMSRNTEVVQQLASKSFRKANPKLNAEFVTNLFIAGANVTRQVHAQNIIVGDFNDLNVLFDPRAVMHFIDVDSFQFGNHPCMVGTENFLPPELYNLDLAKKPYFEELHDWYGWFCMYIRSLLLAHPYGGVHSKYKSLPQRALARITVLDSGVKYPKPAYNPDLLNDNLRQLFERMFSKGERFVPDVQILEDYRDSLVACPSCKMMFPSERKSCPQCTTVNTQQVQRKVNVVKSPGKKTVTCEEMIETPGDFVWHRTHGHSIFAIAHEGTSYVLYHKRPGKPIKRTELFAPKNGQVKFDMFDGRYLVVNQDSMSDEVLVLDISGEKPKGVARLQADEFESEKTFACSYDRVLRVYNGFLLRGSFSTKFNIVDEQQINAVMKNQTWISASNLSTLVFGCQRVFSDLSYFLYRFDHSPKGEFYNVSLPELEPHESILDIDVTFSASALLFLMKTEVKGSTFTRLYVIHQDNGKVLAQYRTPALASDTLRNIHGKAFAKPHGTNGYVLHPTDDGVVQEIIGGAQTLLTETEQFVAESDHLIQFDKGILVVGDKTINYLTLS